VISFLKTKYPMENLAIQKKAFYWFLWLVVFLLAEAILQIFGALRFRNLSIVYELLMFFHIILPLSAKKRAVPIRFAVFMTSIIGMTSSFLAVYVVLTLANIGKHWDLVIFLAALPPVFSCYSDLISWSENNYGAAPDSFIANDTEGRRGFSNTTDE